jgi:flagellar hook-associated protein 2
MGISLNPFSLLSGEGLDVTSLVNQILTQKSGQLSQWGSEQSLLRVQAGLLTTINSDLSRLADAVTALSDPIGALTAQAATSSNPGLLTATADTSVAPGIHSITINNLASAGLVYTDSVTAGANVSILPPQANTGQLTVQIGGSSGTTAAIQITAGTNDTLTTLAASINQQSAANNWGIRAAVVNDVTGSRLSITSQTTGTPGALTTSSNTTTLSFNPPGGGTNASLTIDGIPYLSTSNSIADAIAGVTLNLSGAAPNSPLQLTVAPDTTQISAAINEFVNAYNQVISDINSQFKVDPTTNSEGPLGGDSALRSLQSILLKSVTFAVPDNSGLVNLASLGINMNNDGTLTVGATPAGQSMNQVLASNPQAFRSFFQNATSTGFANAFHADLRNLTDSMDGLINVDLAQNKTQQNNLADSIARFQDQLAAQQKALTNQFALVNASLQTYPMLLRQITQTLSALDTGSKSSSGS